MFVSGGHLWPELWLLPGAFAKNPGSCPFESIMADTELSELLFSRCHMWAQQGWRNVKGKGKQVEDPEAE